MLPDLHTRQEKADWEYVAPQKRTLWQRIAAKTHGLITPGNIITIAGLGLVVIGLVLLVQNQYLAGILTILIGRLADVLDGIVAAHTRTKSSTGELLDSAIDKLILLIAIVCMVFYFNISMLVLWFIVVQNSVNALASGYASLRGHPLHPSRAGKYAMALCWVVILLFLIAAKADVLAVDVAAILAFSVYVLIGGWASVQYVQQAVLK